MRGRIGEGIGERRFFSEDGILAFGNGGNFVI